MKAPVQIVCSAPMSSTRNLSDHGLEFAETINETLAFTGLASLTNFFSHAQLSGRRITFILTVLCWISTCTQKWTPSNSCWE